MAEIKTNPQKINASKAIICPVALQGCLPMDPATYLELWAKVLYLPQSPKSMSAIKKFPDTISIVLMIMVFFIGLTWLVPAGRFDRAEVQVGQEVREVVVQGSYKRVEQSPQGLSALLTAPIRGFAAAAQIIAFVFLVGGAFGILNRTGAIVAALRQLIARVSDKPRGKALVIPSLMVLFSLGGGSFGMSEEVLVFILITVPLALALGYDSIVGVAIPFVGAGAGFGAAFYNPFTIGVAQGIAQVQPFSGIEYRLLVWAAMTTAAVVFVMLYARRVEKKPELSIMYEFDKTRDLSHFHNDQTEAFTLRHRLVLLTLLGALVMLVVGVNQWGWFINEISGLFLGMGVVAAVIFRLSARQSVEAFVEGARDMMTAALVIGLTRGLLLIAEDGHLIDPLLQAIASGAQGMHPSISASIMFLVHGAINFFVPSGSGQAALTMPIMAPLSDLLGITRQTAVLAFQLGDGLFNLIIPTSGVTMGVLAIAKIPFDKWFRWCWPLMLVFIGVGILSLIPPTLLFEWQ